MNSEWIYVHVHEFTMVINDFISLKVVSYILIKTENYWYIDRDCCMEFFLSGVWEVEFGPREATTT